ncbi:MAG: serine/threonine protein kinase [Deltaproteobacteria bacterium]|nr:serine/threonine protein kinase [Deltaproteobacteria bacterium]
MGETVDRYEVVAEIASGGMAVVYAVRRKGIGGFDKLLALKLILPHLAVEERFVQMLLDEARIASQIHHPNVVQVFDVGDAGGVPYMVMEFLRGHSLARIVKKTLANDETIPPGLTLAVLARAAEGLHAAHETLGPDGEPFGIVHRDVSPQNFHVCYNGQVKVVDFGIAAARGKLTMTRTGELKGKLSYLAPEQLTRSKIDRRADIWALGVVAWELLAGKRLFRTDEEATTLDNIVRMPVPDLRAYAPDLPHAVYAGIAACLQRDVDQRITSAGAFAHVLAEGAAELGWPHATDIASFMDGLFATEKAIEQERLAAAVAGPRPIRGEEPDTGSMPFTPAPHQPRTGDIVVEPSHEPAPSPLRHLLWIAPVVGAVILGGSIAWLAGGDEPVTPTPTTPTPTVERAAPIAPVVPTGGPGAGQSPGAAATPDTPEVVTSTITVEVDARARLVLVDGVRIESRPVRIDLGPTDTATVELFYANGDTVRRIVRASDDGVSIGPDARPGRSEARPSATGAAPSAATATRATSTRQPTPVQTGATAGASAGGSGTRPRSTTTPTSPGRSGTSTAGSGTTGRSGRGSGSPLLGSPY